MKSITCLISLALLATPTPAAADDPDAPTFERDIRPLMVKRCTVCHSAKTLSNLDVSAGLALDTYEGVMKGALGRSVLVPGKSAESELIKRLTDPDEDRRMPLSDRELPESDRKRLARWVDAGAPRGTLSAADLAVAKTASTRTRRKLARSLEVVIPLDLKIPANVPDLPAGGPVKLGLGVGPLPSATALAFRGDGRVLAVGTHGAVVLWDLVDVRPARILGDLPGPVHALAFSRDGRRLAVGSGEPARAGLVRVYDVPGGTVLHDFEGHSDVVFGLAFRPDGGQLASGSFDQTARLWDLVIGRSAGVFRGHSDFVYDVAYDADGKSVLSVSKDRSVKRFDSTRVKEIRTYSDHNDDILAVAVPPAGGQFVTAGHESQLRWWDAQGEKPTRRIGGHGGPVHEIAFSADGSRLISAGGDGSVRVWDGKTGSMQKTLPGPTEWQYSAALSGDGKLAAAGGWDGIVRVWDVDQARLRLTLIQPPAESPGENSACEWLAVAPSGFLEGTPTLLGMLRAHVGDKDAPATPLLSRLHHPDHLARAARGESVAPKFP